MRSPITLVCLLCCFALAAGTVSADSTYQWHLPEWLNPPTVPADNPMSQAKVDLGQKLFFDANLSGLGYMSCSSCHQPKLSFTDKRPRAVGITGQFHSRSSMALVNTAYMTTYNWADPNTLRLEDQAMVPLFGDHPLEMAVKGFEEKVLLFLQRDPLYPAMFKEAFPELEVIDFDYIVKALASFERTLISYNSPYDRYRYNHQDDAISEQAKKGEALFYSDRVGCGGCHSGPHFSDATDAPAFHNTGLYNLDGKGGLPEGNQGVFEHTGKPEDIGRFRTPSLRNIQLTAPYMHDGSIATLEEVIEHYAAGGQAAREGRRSPLTSEKIHPFSLTSSEKSELLAFLASLTDSSFIADEHHQTPFK